MDQFSARNSTSRAGWRRAPMVTCMSSMQAIGRFVTSPDLGGMCAHSLWSPLLLDKFCGPPTASYVHSLIARKYSESATTTSLSSRGQPARVSSMALPKRRALASRPVWLSILWPAVSTSVTRSITVFAKSPQMDRSRLWQGARRRGTGTGPRRTRCSSNPRGLP